MLHSRVRRMIIVNTLRRAIQRNRFSASGKVRKTQHDVTFQQSRARERQNRAEIVDSGLTIALVGRPNVGKSTLFNRLINNRGAQDGSFTKILRSVVHPLPGVTRDAREGPGMVGDLMFRVIDTPGFESTVKKEQNGELSSGLGWIKPVSVGNCSLTLVEKGAMDPDQIYRHVYERMAQQTALAVQSADGIFFLIDAAEGVTSLDEELAGWLRKELECSSNFRKSVSVIANKTDFGSSDEGVVDAFSLGFGDPVALSAAYGLGMADLFCVVDRMFNERRGTVNEKSSRTSMGRARCSAADNMEEYQGFQTVSESSPPGSTVETDAPLEKLMVAIVGRPNVGKSTLLNGLLGRERSVMGPAWGITRDPVFVRWKIAGLKPLWLVDTAGIRTTKNSHVSQLESLSVRSSLRALSISHICVVVLDATEAFTKQDIRLISKVVAEGRGLVLALNKWDLISKDDRKHVRRRSASHLRSSLSEIPGVECVELSSIDLGKKSVELYRAIQRTRKRWERRIPTSALTSFVQSYNQRLFLGAGKECEKPCIRFVAQTKTRPPTFNFSGSTKVSEGYMRGLVNAVRKEFGFEGIPIRYVLQGRRGQ